MGTIVGVCDAVLSPPPGGPALTSSTLGRSGRATGVPSFTSYVGLNTHFVQPLPGEFDMMEDAGVRWIRTDISWQAVEPVKGGPYNFSSFDALFAQLKQRDMGIIAILGYSTVVHHTAVAARCHIPYMPGDGAHVALWGVLRGRCCPRAGQVL